MGVPKRERKNFIYGCSCGERWLYEEVALYRGHLSTMGKKDPGNHKAIGRIDTRTGEIYAEGLPTGQFVPMEEAQKPAPKAKKVPPKKVPKKEETVMTTKTETTETETTET